MGSLQARAINIQKYEILTTIGKAKHRRHLIIFAIQQVFAINIGLLYVSNKTTPLQEFWYGPQFMVYVGYLIFSCWCLFRSARMRQTDTDVAVSIGLDYLLYILVVFERSYEQFGAIFDVEGTPLFSYVYLFIAMRSLHYKAGYVYLSGLLAVLSWFALVVVGNATSATQLVSDLRSQTLEAVIASGVVDKLLCILAVTAILGFSVREARQHLYNAAFRGAAGKNLTRMVGSNVAKEVLFNREGMVPGRGHKQSVAILMIDIQQFTKLASESDPSDIMTLLARYQQLVEAVIVRHGGCIDKFMGDGILAHFGAIETSANYAANALRCTENLIEETEQWNIRRRNSNRTPLVFRVSCAVGEAIVGLVGGKTKIEFTVVGDPVNIAAKLEKHAKMLHARGLTTESSFDVAQSQGYQPRFKIRTVRNVRVRGVTKTLDLVIIGEHAATVPEFDAGRRYIA